MNKKTLIAFLVLAFVFTALTACNSDKDTANNRDHRPNISSETTDIKNMEEVMDDEDENEDADNANKTTNNRTNPSAMGTPPNGDDDMGGTPPSGTPPSEDTATTL